MRVVGAPGGCAALRLQVHAFRDERQLSLVVAGWKNGGLLRNDGGRSAAFLAHSGLANAARIDTDCGQHSAAGLVAQFLAHPLPANGYEWRCQDIFHRYGWRRAGSAVDIAERDMAPRDRKSTR